MTVVRELQAQGRDVHILHGGDFLYPSLESQLWDGLQIVDAFNHMNSVAPLYAVAGNHEFDRRTAKQLVAAVDASEFVWVGDNYRFETGDTKADNALQRSYTFDAAGKKIGFVSLTLHPDDGGNARDYVPIDKNYLEMRKERSSNWKARGLTP